MEHTFGETTIVCKDTCSREVYKRNDDKMFNY